MAGITGLPNNIVMRGVEAPKGGAFVAPKVDINATPQVVGDQASINFAGALSLPVETPAQNRVEVETPPQEPQKSAAAPTSLLMEMPNGPVSLGGGMFQTATGGLTMLDEPATVSESRPRVGPQSEREVGGDQLKSLNLDADYVDKNNIRFMHEGSSLFFHAKGGLFEGKSVQLATAGYSNPPAGYAEPTQNFMRELGKELSGNLGLIASPRLEQAGSIEEATTRVAQEQNVPVLYITADEHLQYGKNVPPGVDEQKFRDAPKFSMANPEANSRFAGVLSNSFLVTGGSNQAVSDFMKNIDKGQPVVILNNSDVQSPAFDEKNGRVENPSSFLTTMLTEGVRGLGVETDRGIPKNQFVQNFDRWLDLEAPTSAKEMLNTPNNPNGLVLILDAKDPDAAQKAAAHLNRER